MPVKPTYPGVYIEEIPSGVRSIIGVSTSVAAFVDAFARGPANQPVQIFGMTDFQREFGGLARTSEASYAIQQFFQNGGSEAWAVRVVNDVDTPVAAASSTTLRVQPAAGANVFTVSAGRRMDETSVADPGTWGDHLYLEIDYDTRDPRNRFNLTVSEIVASNGRRQTLRSETFRDLLKAASGPSAATEVVNAGSNLIQLTGLAGWPGDLPCATGTTGAEITAAIPASPVALTVLAGVPGSAARPVSVTHGLGASSNDHATFRPLLEAALRAAAGAATSDAERSLIEGAVVRLIGKGTTTNPYRYQILAGRGDPSFGGAETLTIAGAGATALGLTAATVNAQQVKLGGGSDGLAPTSAQVIGIEADKTGIYALDRVDLFNILCLPAAASFSSASDMQSVYMKAASYCEARRAFLIVDTPESVDTLARMQTWMAQNDKLRHRNAAVYFPRTRISDPLADGRPRSISASGTIAGLYARTDADRGVWKAPAGTDARLRNVLALDCKLTDPQNGALNPLGVNCLRTFPVYSNICWGARTLDGADAQASEWKYIPVRRLTLFIEESLYRGTKWVVFEPNDEPLWAQIRLNVGAFMHTLFRQGAFQGTTPKEAYLVKCDHETTPQADIDAGIVNILVGFAPLKPAEFVIIKIQQMAGDIQV
ncbi:MAG: phage tail sheath C-terminal domain-containing protein [Geminicoccaceae bacterium]